MRVAIVESMAAEVESSGQNPIDGAQPGLDELAHPHSQGDRNSHIPGGALWAMLGFGVLAYYLSALPAVPEMPLGRTPAFDTSLITPGARRIPIGSPPRIQVGYYEYGCNECHGLFVSAPERQGRLAQHTHIELNHGLNARCFNCHDRFDRDRLTLRDGSLIGFDQIPTLCSQCHGTTFRDWERGMHGKDLGTWDRDMGSWRRLTCAECHDPHAPAYPRFVPLPGPNTMRMGKSIGVSQHQESESDNPLAPWWTHDQAGHASGHEQPEVSGDQEFGGHGEPESGSPAPDEGGGH